MVDGGNRGREMGGFCVRESSSSLISLRIVYASLTLERV